MILVSYIDILDFIGEHRQSLIDGEKLFNEDAITRVCVQCKTDSEIYDVQAIFSQSKLIQKKINVYIEISKEADRKLHSKCDCNDVNAGKCGHVAATLIYLHRHSLEEVTKQSKGEKLAEQQKQRKNKQVSKPVEQKWAKIKQEKQQQQRQLRHTRRLAGYIPESKSTEDKDNVVIYSVKEETEVVKKDDRDEKENEFDDPDDENYEDNAEDCGRSSDEDWQPSRPKKKSRTDDSSFIRKDFKDSSNQKSKSTRISKKSKIDADKEAMNLVENILPGESNEFQCPTCDTTKKLKEELKNHVRDVHLVETLQFSCDKCQVSFRNAKSLESHNCGENGTSDDENGVAKSDAAQESPPESPNPPEPVLLSCLLCQLYATNRKALHDHYMLEHDKEGIIVCDRCGEFRLQKDHICPSVIEFKCHMCKSVFKAGRDYWNHFIRYSRKHSASQHRSWCGWAGCGERYTNESDLMCHMRLHLPLQVQLMCSVCNLILRNTDAKLQHMEKHDVGVYECSVCRAGFEDKLSLKEHWNVHSDERPHQCDKCGWRFVNPSSLQSHITKYHEGGPFCCAKCPQKFDDKTDVRIHFGAAHGKVRCVICNFRCANKASLDRHTAKKHGQESVCPHCEAGPFDPASLKLHLESQHVELLHSCATCGEIFTHQRSLRVHMRTHMDGIVCQDCDKAFKSQRDLEEHRRMHTGEKPFICAECGMTFKRAQNLEYHMKGAHKNERNFVCPECSKRFISNADMKRHLRYNHQGGKKWHLCPECGHKLPSLYNLKLHVQSKHTGERPHRCSICNQGFVASSDLKKHILYKHNKEHPFACDKCQKRYQRKRDMQLHQQRHHGDQLFRCQECGKDFESYASMMQHSRYHTTEEPFQCAKCGRRFPHKMNLSRHLCTPDIKKNYHCHTCGLNFTTSGSLKSHRRRLHSGDTTPTPPPAPPQQALTEAPDVEAEMSADSPANGRLETQSDHPPASGTYAVGYKDKIWRANNESQAWPIPSPIQHVTTLTPQSEPVQLSIPDYHELTNVPPNPPSLHLLQCQSPPTQSNAIHVRHGPPPPLIAPSLQRYTTPPVPQTHCASNVAQSQGAGINIQVKATPTALITLPGKVSLETSIPQQNMTYVQTAVTVPHQTPPPPLIQTTPQPPVKIVSMPAALPSSSNTGQGGLILGAPLQTTMDGSFHLVFVPHSSNSSQK